MPIIGTGDRAARRARAVWSQTVELRAALGDPDPVDVRSRLVALDRQAAAAGYGNG
jgi:hypothetical protein